MVQRHAVRAATVVALLLVAVAPRPGAALRSLQESSVATDPGAPVVAGVTLLAWGLALWLSTAVAVSAAGTLPGVVGRCCAAVARRVTPAAVRRATEIALGVSLAAAVSPAGASFAASGLTVVPMAHPVGAATTTAAAGAGAPTAVTLDWPVPAPEATGPGAGPDPVVVRPGDCLWAIARTGLQAGGSAAPSTPEIAQAWPRWWAANRGVLGDDPGLVRPGMHLTPPPA